MTSLERIGFQHQQEEAVAQQSQQQAAINTPQQQQQPQPAVGAYSNPLLNQFQYQQSQNGSQSNQVKQYANETGKRYSKF